MCFVLTSCGAARGVLMGFGRFVRRRLREAAAPAVFLALVGYFLWGATRATAAWKRRRNGRANPPAALAEQSQAEAEVAMWERRVDGLRTCIDADALDERARAMLNLPDPRDVIVPYDKGQRLF